MDIQQYRFVNTDKTYSYFNGSKLYRTSKLVDIKPIQFRIIIIKR